MVIKKLKIFVFVIVLPALLLMAACYLQKGSATKAGKNDIKHGNVKNDSK